MATKQKTEMTKNRAGKSSGALGYLPDVYKGFYRQNPDVGQAIDNLAQVCQTAGPLDRKTAELIKLGIAIGINSEGAIRSHARRALEDGVPAEKIRHVVLLAFTTAGFPHTIAAHKWVEEVLEKAGQKA